MQISGVTRFLQLRLIKFRFRIVEQDFMLKNTLTYMRNKVFHNFARVHFTHKINYKIIKAHSDTRKILTVNVCITCHTWN